MGTYRLISESHSINGKLERSYQQTYSYDLTTAVGIATARANFISDTSLANGAVMAGDPGAWLEKIDFQKGADDLQWVAKLSYTSKYDPDDAKAPTQRQDKYRWSFTTKSKIIDKDINDEAIENSAHDPPIKGKEVDVYLAVLEVTRNVAYADFDQSIFWSYAGKCNASSFLGADEGEVQFLPGQANLVRDPDNGDYWEVSYSFVFDPDRHDLYKFIDEGFNKLDGSDKVKILDDNDEPVTDPVKLDGSGGELGTGQPIEIREYEVIEKLDFSIFNI